ncbi:hypothetical protein JL721_248 [Aureococcus anophagefferens]|nr:hypothetical protein JL721_248 [Aureococcus anophagefferens]
MAATAGPRKDDEMAFADAYELGTIERRVKIDDRKSTDNCFKVFFWLCVLSFVGTSIWLGIGGHARYDLDKSGEIDGVSDHYLSDAKACCDNAGGDYWKESTVCYEIRSPGPTTSGRASASTPEIPVTLVCVVMVLCLSFVKLMEQFAKTVLFGAYFLEIGFLLGLGIYDFARASEATSTAIMFIIFGVLLAAYVFYVRARIASAAETVAAAAHSLLLMPSLLGFVFAWLAVSAVLIVVLILAKVSCWNFASPFFYVAVLLKCCVYSCLRLLTKFALIFHVITGDALWSSGRRTAKLVRKAGVDAMVLETTAMNAFGLLAYGLSLSVAFWMGDVYDKDVLGGDYDSSWRTFMLVAMCILLASPVFAMSLVLFIAIVVGGDVVPVWIPWCCAVFTGGAAAMFFYQAATALLTAADTMFICIALDKEHGVVAIPVKETEVPYATPTNASPV